MCLSSSGLALISFMPQAQDEYPEGVLAGVEACLDNICTYSRSLHEVVPSESLAVEEWRWRNGYFLRKDKSNLHVEWYASPQLLRPWTLPRVL